MKRYIIIEKNLENTDVWENLFITLKWTNESLTRVPFILQKQCGTTAESLLYFILI